MEYPSFTSDDADVEDWSDGDPSTAHLPVPVRGVRPRNRRELTMIAAADLFHERSYPNVSMNDVAERVAMGPSALYRHFRSKQDVLRISVIGALEVLVTRFETSTEPLPLMLARTAVEHRRSGILIRRERRHLDPDNAATAQALLDRLRTVVATRVAESRPDLAEDAVALLADALLAVTWSRSYVSIDADVDRTVAHLAGLCARLLGTDLGATGDAGRSEVGFAPLRSRRERVLTAAVRLFAERSYATVSIAQICARAGVSATTVYRLLGSKADILHAAATRYAETLLQSHARAIATAADAPAAARQALHALAEVHRDHADLATANVDIVHLETDARRTVAAADKSFLEEWDLLLASVLVDLEPDDRAIRLVALVVVCAEIARDEERRAGTRFAADLVTLGSAVLDLPPLP